MAAKLRCAKSTATTVDPERDPIKERSPSSSKTPKKSYTHALFVKTLSKKLERGATATTQSFVMVYVVHGFIGDVQGCLRRPSKQSVSRKINFIVLNAP